MGDTLSNIFIQTLMRYGIIVAISAVVIFAAVVLFAYYAKKRIDIMYKESEQREAERAQEIASRDNDRKTLMDEVKLGREQMIGHMERDRKEKDRLTRTLGSMVAEIRASVKVLDHLSEKITAQDTKSEQRVVRIYGKLDEMHRDIVKGENYHGGA